MLAEARWAPPEVLQLLAKQHPRWQLDDDSCPACVQQAMLQLLSVPPDLYAEPALADEVRPIFAQSDIIRLR